MPNNWDTLLPSAEFAYNSAKSEDLGATPFEVDLGWQPRDPLFILRGKVTSVGAAEVFQVMIQGTLEDAKIFHELAKARQSVKSPKQYTSPTYKIGDMFWVSKKLLEIITHVPGHSLNLALKDSDHLTSQNWSEGTQWSSIFWHPLSHLMWFI